MHPNTSSVAPADKARAVAHYTRLAAQAAKTRKPALPRKPDLSSITGWQADRRRAVALLEHQQRLARAAMRHDEADAYWSAAYDVKELLRERAAGTITESCTMPFTDVGTHRELRQRWGLQ